MGKDAGELEVWWSVGVGESRDTYISTPVLSPTLPSQDYE
jgi:hypothetical protein